MMLSFISRWACALTFGLLVLNFSASAATFTGSNTSGSFRDFTITVPAGTTNLSLVLPGTASAYSHLLLRRGTAPNDTTYDFSSQVTGNTNSLYLEVPEISPGDYVVRVRTPAASAAHNFTLQADFNQAGLRLAAKPVTKPLSSITTGSAPANTWHYYRLEVRTNITGLQVKMFGTTAPPDLYIARNVLPTTGGNIKSSTGQTNDFAVLTASEVTPGIYFVGVNGPSGSPGPGNYELRTEILDIKTLNWDPGVSHAGTEVFAATNVVPEEYYFRIQTQNSSVGAWRTALNVVTGEASLFMARGVLPTSGSSAQIRSERPGHDGIVLGLGATGNSGFLPGEDWYIVVRANANSRWSLVSGSPYVQNLGLLAADGSSGSGPVEIGPEGIRYFRTIATTNALAWRLYLNGATNGIYVRRTQAPVPIAGPTFTDFSQNGQMLVVPQYLQDGQYYVGVIGNPGTTINLDSREHSYTEIPFGQVTDLITVTGYGYRTFAVTVPPSLEAWQVNVFVTNGNPNVAVRKGRIPNELFNEGYSEAGGTVTDSVTLVPKPPNTQGGLSDGTWFITVYANGTNSFRLFNGRPTISDIDFVSSYTNEETNRVGWRFFRVQGGQLGTILWELSLSNSIPGTRIAVRRVNVPAIWTTRNPSLVTETHLDVMSDLDFLQLPNHQEDTWYIGVFNPSNILGNFTLHSRAVVPTPLIGDGASATRTDVRSKYWQYFRVTIPSNIFGWDLRLVNVTSGLPRLYIRRDLLPQLTVTPVNTITGTNWPSGQQWTPLDDWTKRPMSELGSTNEQGRVAVAGMGRPLEPGTYYVGVWNPTDTNAMAYTIRSRFIGGSIPITDISFTNGSATNFALGPREAAYYRVSVPQPVPTWKVSMAPISGEAMIAYSTNGIPPSDTDKRVQKEGKEHFAFFPPQGEGLLPAGTYWIVVAGEGDGPVNNQQIASGSTAYTVTSHGVVPEVDLGLLGASDLIINDGLEGGEIKSYNFRLPEGALGYELFIENPVGNPWASVTALDYYPDPGFSSERYGHEGGLDNALVTESTPFSLIYATSINFKRIAMMARSESVNGRLSYPDASYTLRIKLITYTDLDFEGIANVAIPAEEEWRFFRVVVPPDALGWDLRMTNVQSGTPRMIISKTGIGLGSTADIVADRIASWPDYGEWEIFTDWTERTFAPDGRSEWGQVAAMGMGRPLSPGVYFISVYNPTFTPVTAQIWSRGIGPGFSVPVGGLDFNGGTATITDLPGRNAAYFEVNVPEGMPSWKVTVDALAGESLLIVSKQIPNIEASSILSITNTAGRKMQKHGSENFHFLPTAGQTTIPGGRYYVTVVSEGVTINSTTIGDGGSSFKVTSHGPAPVMELGTVGETAIVRSNSIPAGDTIFYRFDVPTNVTRVEARLDNRVGNPVGVAHIGPLVPAPGVGFGTILQDLYGYEGGETTSNDVHTTSVQILNPRPGTYYLAVKARPLGSVHTNASYVLRLSALGGGTALDFDGGFLAITNHQATTWRYFLVEVPTNAAGWDIRITNVLSGLPKMSIRRGALPTQQLTPIGLNAASTSWALSNQWIAAQDWTRRGFSTNGTVNEDGRIAAFGMGSPLEPGTYYIGVTSGAGSATNLSYTISSRGIGDGFSIPLIEIPYEGGSATNDFLPARDAAYYKIVVPSNSPSLKVKLTVTSGEAMLVARRDRMPNVDTVAASADMVAGKGMQKPGNEHLVILPINNETNIPSGTNYFVVVSEGSNPSANNRIGVGGSSFIFSCQGPLQVQDLGYVSSSDTLHIDAAEAGETKAYEFIVQPGSWGMEVKLEERSGNPVMVLRAKSDTRAYLPDPSLASPAAPLDAYGSVGGQNLVLGVHPTIITKANALPVTHYLVVKPRAVAPAPALDATYRLRIRELLTPELNFDSAANTNGLNNTVTGTLENNQRAFYRVFIPETNYNGNPVLGWRLRVSQSSGLAEIRVRKDALPEDNVATAFSIAAQVLVPPYLTTGVYYVEVKGSNSTPFTLTSSALELNRPSWLVPEKGRTNVAPGLTYPLFGDSGVDTNGVPLEGNGSIFLEQGNVDYYGFIVPTQNVGVVKVYLESVSGNPDVYMRQNLPPTVHHTATITAGTLADRRMEALTSEYANWVPVDKSEMALRPGTYYLAVFARGNANSRYRLRLMEGNIIPVDPRGTALTNQLVANTDWIYYRVTVPTTAPYQLQVSWFQETGDLDMHVRDTVPPGNGLTSTAGEIKDWVSDRKNEAGANTYQTFPNPGTYVLTAPPVRLGTDLYFGFRATRDSTFRVSFTNLVDGTQIPAIDFYSGSINTSIPGRSEALFRVLAPQEARRWRHTSVHNTNIQVAIEQGTLPRQNSTDDYRATTNNSSFNRDLYSGWPWVTNVIYFISVTNSSTLAEPFQLSMDGRNAETDDNDNDLLPDIWEMQYFRTLAIIPNADNDGDGVTNYEEYLQGTEPNNRASFQARLIIFASNGTVTKNPNQTSYALGSEVTLTAVPNNGYSFVRWSGTDNSFDNPLTVVMNAHRTNTAVFKIRGDDFVTREPLQSSTTITATTINATKETGEPNHAGNSGGRSIWWRWTASIDEQITITTRGSTFNTLLAVYTGDSVSNLVLIAGDDNGDSNLTSRVTFNAVAGTTYAIAVDGVNGASGSVTLGINGTAPTQPVAFRSPARLQDGRFQFTITGDAGVNLVVQYSTNLTQWTTLSNITTTGASTLFTDPQTGQSRRFYRLQRN